MKKIVALYIRLLQDFNIKTIDAFVEKFYMRMGRERFESILRTYGIAPSQHKEIFVLQGLEVPSTARNETHTSQPSESSALSLSSTHEELPQVPGMHNILDAEQIQSTRDTILEIERMVQTDIDDDKRKRLLSRKNNLMMRIQSVMIPEGLDEDIILEENSFSSSS